MTIIPLTPIVTLFHNAHDSTRCGDVSLSLLWSPDPPLSLRLTLGHKIGCAFPTVCHLRKLRFLLPAQTGGGGLQSSFFLIILWGWLLDLGQLCALWFVWHSFWCNNNKPYYYLYTHTAMLTGLNELALFVFSWCPGNGRSMTIGY